MTVKNDTVEFRPQLAILDWGIGGMEFYRLFKENNPCVGVCYFSDSGSIPYGKQQKRQLLNRLGFVTEFLWNQGVTHLVVACNAMSTVLPYWLPAGEISNLHITGVIEPAISAVLEYGKEKVGITGGRRTILSGAYSKPLRGAVRKVTQRVAQPISALIEKGEKDTAGFYETLRKIMLPLKQSDILVLACTHYPAAQDAFQKLSPGARIINPAAETLERVVNNWCFKKESSGDIFYTTGNPEEMRSSSLKAFGVKIGEIIRISQDLGPYDLRKNTVNEKSSAAN